MIEISVAVIALAFVVLVIFLVKVLISIGKTLDQVNRTLPEVQELLRSTQKTTNDVNEKLEALDAFFKAISLVGDKALSATRSFKEASEECRTAKMESFTNESDNGSTSREHSEAYSRVDQVMEWVALGVKVWDTVNKRR